MTGAGRRAGRSPSLGPREVTLAIALLAAGAGTARAQQSGPPPDGTTAVLLSLAGTAVPMAIGARGEGWLFLGGMLLGPSLGYFYGGVAGRGLRGVGLRALVMGGSVVAAIAICGDCSLFDDSAENQAAAGVLVLGFLTTIVLDIKDIFSVDGAIAEHHQARVSLGLVEVPDFGAGFGLSVRH